jgi:hypothetical protein
LRRSDKIDFDRASLVVDSGQKRRRVDLETDRDEYRLGEEVTADLPFTNAAGEGARQKFVVVRIRAGDLHGWRSVRVKNVFPSAGPILFPRPGRPDR